MQGDVMDKKLNIECPDFEDISAYFDNELDVTSPEYIHIKTCELCQQELEACSKIDFSIKREFREGVPDGFAEGLIASIKAEEMRDASPAPLGFRKILRVAALFFICGVAAYFIISGTDTVVPATSSVDLSPEPLVFLNKKEVLRAPYHFQPLRKAAAGTENSIDMKKFMNVSSGTSGGEYLSGLTCSNKHTAFIKPVVKQIWSVDNLHRVKDKILEFAVASNIRADRKGNLVAQFNLTKKELAEFVRYCKKSGFRLLSPSQPQPEETTFLGNKNDKVSYTATFVLPQ
jgi:hypothetical protein